MDDVSIISIPDSDISIRTLLDADETTFTQLDQLTPNERFYACSLFVSHWVDGIIKTDEDLRSAKKYYVERLKEKPNEIATIVFEKKTSRDNMNTKPKEKSVSISSRNTGRSRSPLLSNKSERKTATIARRKTILIDPIHTQKPTRPNPFAATKNIKVNQRSSSSSSNDTVRFQGDRFGTTSRNHTYTSGKLHEENKFQSKNNLPKPKNDFKTSHCRVPKHSPYSNRPSSSHRGLSSSHRAESSSRRAETSSHRVESSSHRYGLSSDRREFSSRSERSTHRSSDFRDRKSNKRRSSKDSNQSHLERKSRLSEDRPKSKQFSKSTEKEKLSSSKFSENVLKVAQRMDNITADMLNSSIKLVTASPLKEVDLFEMEHDATNAFSNRENPLKNYKIPKNGGYCKQLKSIVRNESPAKSSSNHRINTSLSTSTTPKTHRRSNDEKPITMSLTSEAYNHNYQKENSSDAKRTAKSSQHVYGKNALPDVPVLDNCITSEMNPAVIVIPLKLRKKQIIASGNDNYIVRNKNGKIRITKYKKENHSKLTEQHSTTKTNEVATTKAEVVTSEAVNTETITYEANTEIITSEAAITQIATNEAATSEVISNEVTPKRVATIEDVTNEIPSKEFASNGDASEPIVDMPIQNNSSHDAEIQVFDDNEIPIRDNNIRIQIDSSQQTEVSTSNFGGQKNDEEMDELLRVQGQSISIFKEAVQEYEESIKEREHEIVSQKKTIKEQQNMIEEREKIIKERDKMIAERDLMIREREQKLKDYEDKVRIKEHVTDMELTKLQRVNASLVGVLREKEAHCNENHKEKPKPRTLKPKPHSNSHLEMIWTPNMPVTSNLNVFQNEIIRSSPQQGLSVRNINELTGNSPPIMHSPPSTFHPTCYSSSSSTLAQLLTNPSNITNTFSNAAPISTSKTAHTSINNAAATSVSNAVQQCRQQEQQQILVQGPNLDFTLDLDTLNAVSNSSTLTYPQAIQPQITVSQNLFPTQPTTSTATQPHSSCVTTAISSNVQTPHQMIPRQPERTKSVSSKPNQMVTSTPQRLQQRSQLRNRANTFVPGTQRNFDINGAQRWQQNNLQHIQNTQQVQHGVSPQALNQSTANQCTGFQQPVNQQPIFYCLGCYKTANLVCETCHNCCTCSEFCYEVIAEKHKRDCILPNMVSISSLN